MPSTPAGGFSNNGTFVGQDGKNQAGWLRGPGQPSTGDTPIDGSATDFGGLAATPSTSRPVTGHQNLLNGLWSQMNHGYSEGNPEVPNQALQHMPQQPPQAFDLNNMFGIQDLQWDSSLLLPVCRSKPRCSMTDMCSRDSTALATSSFPEDSFIRDSALVSCKHMCVRRFALLIFFPQITKLYADGFQARQSCPIIIGDTDAQPCQQCFVVVGPAAIIG
jgi:hypothetical protein